MGDRTPVSPQGEETPAVGARVRATQVSGDRCRCPGTPCPWSILKECSSEARKRTREAASHCGEPYADARMRITDPTLTTSAPAPKSVWINR
jgi:hypothetical protein